jgi:hypothetical protein
MSACKGIYQVLCVSVRATLFSRSYGTVVIEERRQFSDSSSTSSSIVVPVIY